MRPPASELGTFGHQSIAGGPGGRWDVGNTYGDSLQKSKKNPTVWDGAKLKPWYVMGYFDMYVIHHIFIISTGAGFLNHQPFSA